jgi:hypothetical protein
MSDITEISAQIGGFITAPRKPLAVGIVDAVTNYPGQRNLQEMTQALLRLSDKIHDMPAENRTYIPTAIASMLPEGKALSSEEALDVPSPAGGKKPSNDQSIV